jgi:hypothetical protein
VDLGFVGDIESVNPDPLRLLQERRLIPVIAPVATGRGGETYNVNADHVAGAVAGALGAAALLELTNVPGILDRDGHPLRVVSRRGLECLVRERVIDGGMLPKVDAALRALGAGTSRVQIVDGRHPHAVVLTLLARDGRGTEIVLEGGAAKVSHIMRRDVTRRGRGIACGDRLPALALAFMVTVAGLGVMGQTAVPAARLQPGGRPRKSSSPPYLRWRRSGG